MGTQRKAVVPTDDAVIRAFATFSIELFREVSALNVRLPHGTVAILLFAANARIEGRSPFQISELREALGLGQSSCSRLCASLQRAGMLKLTTPEDDRRCTNVELTPHCWKTVQKAVAPTVWTILEGKPYRQPSNKSTSG